MIKKFRPYNTAAIMKSQYPTIALFEFILVYYIIPQFVQFEILLSITIKSLPLDSSVKLIDTKYSKINL